MPTKKEARSFFTGVLAASLQNLPESTVSILRAVDLIEENYNNNNNIILSLLLQNPHFLYKYVLPQAPVGREAGDGRRFCALGAWTPVKKDLMMWETQDRISLTDRTKLTPFF